MGVVVIGQMGRDLALRTERLPDVGGTEPIVERVERLGGKGANQAVGLSQLGVPVSLVAVVGLDDAGMAVLNEAAVSGIDVDHVVQRGSTALLVSHVDGQAHRRLFEDIPESAVLTVQDIDRAATAIDRADTVSIQLQQPIEAVLAAARRGRRVGARVIADGAVERDAADELLALVDVLRADAKEAELLAGEPVRSVEEAVVLAKRVLKAGPELVALAIPEVGDLLVWPGGSHLEPLSNTPTIDRTGAGDAFVAGLVAALRHGDAPVDAGRLASKAASATVTHLGGRPDLSSLEQAA
jgi:ribokinase